MEGFTLGRRENIAFRPRRRGGRVGPPDRPACGTCGLPKDAPAPRQVASEAAPAAPEKRGKAKKRAEA